MLTKIKKNIGITILIIGILYLSSVIYNASITSNSLSNREELSKLDLSIDRTAYFEELGFELNETKSYEILSEITF